VDEQVLPLLAGLIVVIVVLWIVANRGRAKKPSVKVAQRRGDRRPVAESQEYGDAVSSGGAFQAYMLQVSTDHCFAAKSAPDNRYLAGEVPDLPLPECDRNCRCKFVGAADRHKPRERRAAAFPADDLGEAVKESDRRTSYDRRRRKR